MEKKKLSPYYILEIDKEATPAQIKTAYKKLALKWHPDKNGGSEESTEKFKKISEAYAILSNPKRRQRYDMFGDTGEDGDDFDDIFGDLFGGMADFGPGAGSFDDFEQFMEMLEKDNIKSFKQVFRTLGKNYGKK